MKVGIDSYCFHRFFGEVYGHQAPPPFQMTVFDFLDFAKEVGVDGVSLESCFLPSFDKGFLAELKARPGELHVICTGRNAPPQLVDAADLVTEMREIKHPFYSGVPAQRGIEY